MSIIKENKKDVTLAIIFALCSLVSLMFAVKMSKADSQWQSKSIAYDSTKTNLTSNNAQDAVDELNAMLDGNTYNANNAVTCDNYTNGCKKEEVAKENPKTGDGIAVVCLLVVVSAVYSAVAVKYILKIRKSQM